MSSPLFTPWQPNAFHTRPLLSRASEMAQLSALGYMGTRVLTSVSPKKGALFIALIYATSNAAKPHFVRLTEPYRAFPLVPLAGHCALYFTSILAAKVICAPFTKTLTFLEVAKVIASLCVAIFTALFVTSQLTKYKQRHHNEIP